MLQVTGKWRKAGVTHIGEPRSSALSRNVTICPITIQLRTKEQLVYWVSSNYVPGFLRIARACRVRVRKEVNEYDLDKLLNRELMVKIGKRIYQDKVGFYIEDMRRI